MRHASSFDPWGGLGDREVAGATPQVPRSEVRPCIACGGEVVPDPGLPVSPAFGEATAMWAHYRCMREASAPPLDAPDLGHLVVRVPDGELLARDGVPHDDDDASNLPPGLGEDVDGEEGPVVLEEAIEHDGHGHLLLCPACVETREEAKQAALWQRLLASMAQHATEIRRRRGRAAPMYTIA